MDKAQGIILDFIQSLHDVAAEAMIKSAPIVAPIPSALALYKALSEAYGAWAIVIAVAVEILGYSAIALLIRAIEENASKPLLAASGVFSAIYIGTVFGSIALLPHNEGWAIVARAFPLLTVVGAGVYSTNHMLDARKAQPFDEAKQVIDLDDYKQRLRIERTALKQSTTPTPSAPKQDKRAEAEKYMRDNPSAKEAEFVESTGQSRATYYRIKRGMR